MKTKGISRVVALLLLFTLLLSVSPLTEVAWAAETETGAAEPVPKETEVSEAQDAESVLQETAASETEEPEVLPPAEESTSEEQEPQKTEDPAIAAETDAPSETEPEEPAPTEAPEEDLTWMDAGLLLLVNGTLRCEVYSKEKGLTGSASGDNTVAAIKAKGYTATNTSGWYVKSGTAASTAMGYFQINRSQSNGNPNRYHSCALYPTSFLFQSGEPPLKTAIASSPQPDPPDPCRRSESVWCREAKSGLSRSRVS